MFGSYNQCKAYFGYFKNKVVSFRNKYQNDKMDILI